MQRGTRFRVLLGLGAVALAGAPLQAAAQQSPPQEIRRDARQAGERVEQGAERAGQEAREAAGGQQRPLSDAWLTAKTKLALFADDQVSGFDVNVDTKDRVVTLKGEVDSEAQRQQALRVARQVEGVKEVRDQLTVNAGAGKADAGASRSGAAGAPSPGAGEGTQNRGATQSVAPTGQDRAIATGTGGAVPTSQDDEIAARVRQRIAQAWPQGEFKADGEALAGPGGQKIEVDVRDGIVTLKGKVRDVQDIVKAAQAARRVPGVRAIRTDIESGQPS